MILFVGITWRKKIASIVMPLKWASSKSKHPLAPPRPSLVPKLCTLFALLVLPYTHKNDILPKKGYWVFG